MNQAIPGPARGDSGGESNELLKLDEVIYSPSGRPFMVAGHKEDRTTGNMVPEGKPILPFFS